MSKKASNDVDPPPTQKRGTRFIPLEDAPLPGMSQRAREVIALALCGFSLYAMLSLATFRLADLDGPIPAGDMQNLGGAVGYYLAFGFARSLGLAGWIPFLLLLALALTLFLGRSCSRVTIKVLGAVVFAAMMAVLFAGRDGLAGVRDATPYGAGGVFGAFVSPRLDEAFGGTGRLLLVGFGALVSLLIATEWMFSQLLLRVVAAVEPLWRRLYERPAAATVGVGSVESLDEDRLGEGSSLQRRSAEGRGRAAQRDGGLAIDSAARGADPESDDAAGSAVIANSGPADVAADESVAAPLLPRRGRRQRQADALAEALAEEAAVVRALGEPEAESTVDADADADADTDAGAEAEPPTATDRKPVIVMAQKPKPRPKPKPKRSSAQSTLPFQDYPFPPIELFRAPVMNDLGETSEALASGGEAIVNKLANFNIESEIVAASVGPAVTQYELRLAESIRVNKIVGFESDLAAALKAFSVRVVAPIPGKDTIGIEVPNAEREKVYMRDLLDQFGRSEDAAIPLYLGKDVAGTPIVEDLARMPHLLIAGTTGSGKSVCINTILLSILMTRTPQQVKLVLVDPKMVELQAYKRVPHLCCEVVTNMKKAPGVLQWAVDEMENRYSLLSVAGVNHIRNYNRLGAQELAKRLNREPDPDRVFLSYIVIVIDEFADLMNVAANEVEELIQRLAQKSRAVGMHVILATQRPSSEVITGIIKANLPCQIAFKVNRRIDSRVILDANGAEKLLGHGDMLYMPPGGGALMRAQGTFVADDELLAVVKFLEENGQQPAFNPELVQRQSSSRPAVGEQDDRYREAVEVILGQQRGSATLLQRALAVGYTRATRLLELMEEDGLVGPFVGSKSREVLMTLEEWQAREDQAAAEAELVDLEHDDDGAADFDDAGNAGDDGPVESRGEDAAGGDGGGDAVSTDEPEGAAEAVDEDDVAADEDEGEDEGEDQGEDEDENR